MANLVRCGARSRRGVACNTLLVHGQPPFELTDDNTEPVDRMCVTCRARLDRRRVQERRNKQKCRQRSEADQTCQRCHRTKEQLAAAAIKFRMDSVRTCASCLETQRLYQRSNARVVKLDSMPSVLVRTKPLGQLMSRPSGRRSRVICGSLVTPPHLDPVRRCLARPKGDFDLYHRM